MLDIDDNVYSYFQSQMLLSVSSDPYNKNDNQPHTIMTTQQQLAPTRTLEDEGQNEKVAHGMKLLLAARERVLTLAEQRVSLIPIMPDLAASQLVASLDMAPLATQPPAQ
ncbi:hypothetical protein JOM56_011022 [Amanita muscaria]